MKQPQPNNRPDDQPEAADERLEWRKPKLSKMPAADAQGVANPGVDGPLHLHS